MSIHRLLKRIINKIYRLTLEPVCAFTQYWLYQMSLPSKVNIIRNKERITVLFIISEVSSWKTELLYNEMLKRPRFNPLLGVSTSSAPSDAKEPLVLYLESKGYSFIDLDSDSRSIDSISPDIIFYYKPYSACYSKGHFFDKNLKYVFCGLDYGFNITTHPIHLIKPIFLYCWHRLIVKTPGQTAAIHRRWRPSPGTARPARFPGLSKNTARKY